MKLSRVLLLLGICANAISLLAYWLSAQQPSSAGSGMLYVLFIFPAIWIVALIAAGALLVSYKKPTPDSSASRILGFVLCTPLPMLAAFSITYYYQSQGTSLFAHSVEYKNGFAYKTEIWDSTAGARTIYITKIFKGDSLGIINQGEKAYSRDSTWFHIGPNDDTLRVERYRNGLLISSKP